MRRVAQIRRTCQKAGLGRPCDAVAWRDYSMYREVDLSNGGDKPRMVVVGYSHCKPVSAGSAVASRTGKSILEKHACSTLWVKILLGHKDMNEKTIPLHYPGVSGASVYKGSLSLISVLLDKNEEVTFSSIH